MPNNNKDFAHPAARTDIQLTMAALEANGFKVKLVENLKQLYDAVLSMIPEGSEVATGASETLRITGLDKTLNLSGKYVSVREKYLPLAGKSDKVLEMRRIGSASDYAVGSIHAITQDGQVLIASASGSQLPNYVYGASNFIWVAGSQKLVKDLDEALKRIEDYTFPLEDKRAMMAYGAHSSINKILIYRKETSGRGTIIIVNQAIGY